MASYHCDNGRKREAYSGRFRGGKKADDSLEEAQLAFDQEMNKAKAEAAEILEKANSRASQIVNDATAKAEIEAEKILSSAAKTIENDVNKAKERVKAKNVRTYY